MEWNAGEGSADDPPLGFRDHTTQDLRHHDRWSAVGYPSFSNDPDVATADLCIDAQMTWNTDCGGRLEGTITILGEIELEVTTLPDCVPCFGIVADGGAGEPFCP